MKQKFTVLFDLDGTLVDTAPDLMRAHNHVMKKYGYPTKSTNEIRNLVGKGAGAMIGRSIWGQAKKEFGKVNDEKVKKEDESIKVADKCLNDINQVNSETVCSDCSLASHQLNQASKNTVVPSHPIVELFKAYDLEI